MKFTLVYSFDKKKGRGVVAGDIVRLKWKFLFELFNSNSFKKMATVRVFLIGTHFETIWQTNNLN